MNVLDKYPDLFTYDEVCDKLYGIALNVVSDLINMTPSGEERNLLTNVKIELMLAKDMNKTKVKPTTQDNETSKD